MVLRVTGLASGMDIEKMVSDLMKAERVPLDKLKQKKQTSTWQTDLYREINTKLASLRTTLSDMKLSTDWKATKATSSNESVVSVTTANGASTISHNIEVLSLAKGATVSSGVQLSNAGLSAASSASLTIDGTNNQFNATLNGATKTVTITSGTYATADDLQKEIQKQLDVSFGSDKVKATQSGGVFSFVPAGYDSGSVNNRPQFTIQDVGSKTALTSLGFDTSVTPILSYKLNKNTTFNDLVLTNKLAAPLNSASGSFTINGQEITYSETDTLAAVMGKVNNSAAGVTMSYDDISDKIVFSTKSTGSSAIIDFDSDNGGLLNSLGISVNDSAQEALGSDTHLKIDGVESYRTSNTFTLEGVTYTLNGEGTASINVQQDVDAMTGKITSFVEKYNETIELLNTRVGEKKDRNYSPLTDTQKESMKDSEIELWESKAKIGLLQNDTILKNTLGRLRSLLITEVSGVSSDYNALYKVGIETLPYDISNPQNSGKIKIDETKLKQALSDNPDAVISMFTNYSTTDNEIGIASRMYNELTAKVSELTDKAGAAGTAYNIETTDLGYGISKTNKRITEMEAKLVKKEDYYYQRFSLMEKAIQNGNAQMSWLSSQFS